MIQVTSLIKGGPTSTHAEKPLSVVLSYTRGETSYLLRDGKLPLVFPQKSLVTLGMGSVRTTETLRVQGHTDSNTTTFDPSPLIHFPELRSEF